MLDLNNFTDKILYEWNNTSKNYSEDKTIYDLFVESVNKYGHSTALISNHRFITYRELHEKVASLSYKLRSKGVTENQFIGIFLNRSINTIVSLLAILKLGCTYVPFNISDPAERIKNIIKQVDLSLIITSSDKKDFFKDTTEVFFINNPSDIGITQIDESKSQVTSDSNAYIIFTSGTTGVPKGVLIKHKTVINLIEWVNRTFEVDSNDILLWTTNLSFDLSVYDIFGVLAAGGAIRILSEEEQKDPERQVSIIFNEGITFWDSAPQGIQRLISAIELRKTKPKSSRMRLFFASGDWVPLSQPDSVRSYFPNAEFVALGGATEATIWSNYFVVKEIDPAWNSIPYGKPIQNCRYYILNEKLNHCEPGIEGDLYIAGECLAVGYYGDPLLTEKKFLPDPFFKGGRMYLTGDRARWMDDGNIEFLGRIDEQFKIRGYRVELEEIRSKVRSVDGVDDISLFADKTDRINPVLVLAYTSKKKVLDGKKLRTILLERLPDYMVPSRILKVNKFPLTENGKVDTKSLLTESLIVREDVYPDSGIWNDEILVQVKEIWEEVFEQKIGDPDVNFFEIGGESLIGMRVITSVARNFNISIPYPIFFSECHSIRKMASFIRKNSNNENRPIKKSNNIIQADKLNLQSLSEIQRQFWFLYNLNPEDSAYNIFSVFHIAGIPQLDKLEESIKIILERYEVLRVSIITMDSEPQQIVHSLDELNFEIPCIKLETELTENEVPEQVEEEVNLPFDLAEPPLFRIKLFTFSNDKSILTIVFHHIIIDTRSEKVFSTELSAIYNSLIEGKQPDLKEVKNQYLAYTKSMQSFYSSENNRKKLEDWVNEYPEQLERIALPSDYQKKPGFYPEGQGKYFTLEGSLYRQIKKFSEEFGYNPFRILLTAYVSFLHRLTNQETIIVGVPLTNRVPEFTKDIIGCFVNMLPLKIHFNKESSFKSVLDQVKNALSANLDRQEIPLLDLVKKVKVDRSISNSFFQTGFTFKPQMQLYLDDVEAVPVKVYRKGSQLDLLFTFFEEEEKFVGYAEFNTQIIKKNTVDTWIDTFKVLVSNFLDNHDERVKFIDIFETNIEPKEYIVLPTIKKQGILLEKKHKASSYNKQNNFDDSDIQKTITDLLELSSDQLRFWMITKINQNSPLHNIPYTIKFTGNLSLDYLKESIEYVLNRHIVFRTSISLRDGKPYCRLLSELKSIIRILDWSNDKYDENRIQDFLTKESRNPFNLEEGPLFRGYIIIINRTTIILHLTVHHIIIDGWSLELLMNDIEKSYNELVLKGKIELPSIEYDFYDYTKEINENQNKTYYRTSLAYWKQRLSNPPEIINLPWQQERPSVLSGTGGRFSYRIPKEIGAKLIALSRKERVSLFSLFYSSLSLLLHKYSGDDDICIGSAVTNRNRSKSEKIIGLFVNTVVLRKIHSGNETMKDLIHECSQIVLEALSNQEVPFDKVVENLEIRRNQNINPIFQVVLSWNTPPKTIFGAEKINLEQVTIKEGNSPLDLNFYAYEKDQTIHGEIEYSNDVFNRDFVLGVYNSLNILLEQITKYPERKTSEFSIVSEEECTKLKSFTLTNSSYPKVSIDYLFREMVKNYSDKPAILYKDSELTYAELDLMTDQMASKLIEARIELENVVGLFTPKSAEYIIGMLAILKAGATYLPLDPDFPIERTNFMIRDTQCRLVLTVASCVKDLSENIKYLLLDDPEHYLKSPKNLILRTSANNLAYIMYTSGTTGKPKGSLIEHKSIVRLVRNTNYISLDSTDNILLTGAIGFDATTFEIWGALLNGGTLHVVDKEVILDPALLDKELKTNRITTLWLTSSLFTQLAQTKPELFSDLKYLLAGGDVLSVEHINKVRALYPKLTIINGYGPTENTTFSTCHIIEKEYTGSIPIGKPISNSTAYIFDKDMNYCPIGVPGELYVGGDGLSRGYLHDEELTSTKFIEHPFIPGERLFKTGDRAKWLPDGTIAFYGRIDNQLKINGFRVELGEIESILTQLPEIQAAVVERQVTDSENPELQAYIQISNNQELTREYIDTFMLSHLPPFMVPTSYKLIDKMPLTVNGKVDRKALEKASLRMLSKTKIESDNEQDELIDKVRLLWNNILGRETTSIDAEFFEMGGHSLLAMRFISAIEADYKLNILYRTFLTECNTVRKMAAFLRSNASNIVMPNKDSSKKSFKHMFCIQSEGEGHPLFNIFGEEVLLFTDEHFGRNYPVYSFLWPKVKRLRFEIRKVEELADEYIKQIKEANSSGPYYLIGYSFGGLLVYEIATRLAKEGYEVPLLCIIDSQHPAAIRDNLMIPKKKLLEFGLGVKPKLKDWYVVAKGFLGLKMNYDSEKQLLYYWVKKVYRRYRPQIYEGKLILFRSEINTITDKTLGWKSVVKNIEVIDLPGGHQDATKDFRNKVVVSAEIRRRLLSLS